MVRRRLERGSFDGEWVLRRVGDLLDILLLLLWAGLGEEDEGSSRGLVG